MDKRSGYIIYPDGTVAGREGTLEELAEWAVQAIIEYGRDGITVKIQRVTDTHVRG